MDTQRLPRLSGRPLDLDIAGALFIPEIGSERALPAASIRRRYRPDWIVWVLRCLMLVPFVLMTPLVIAATAGHPGAVENISTANADVLGTSSLMFLLLMLAVTPLQTITGWRWHLILRRDFGLALFATASTDLFFVALTAGDGGVVRGVAGRPFLIAGTVATLLLVPLALTSTRRAQKRLGRQWKRLHWITYIVWGLVLLHLELLFGFSKIFYDALAVSFPLLVLRAPAVRRWWSSARRTGTHRSARRALAMVLVLTFVVGFTPFANELGHKGVAAFQQHPIDDGD